MKQYLDLLKAIQENGTDKPAARTNMPGTRSLFGHQLRHDLADGFPLLTTKRMFWKGVVVELLWFLRGDTNIKYLLDNGVNIWNGDAYNYYKKVCEQHTAYPMSFDSFIQSIKDGKSSRDLVSVHNVILRGYKPGDCGQQYGKLWRDWKYITYNPYNTRYEDEAVDQITDLITGLRNNPESRRHILTAWNPATLGDMALNACHAMVQFNCRPMTIKQSYEHQNRTDPEKLRSLEDNPQAPEYYLDCQLYQRSADTILGVPFNIASYSLLTHIIAKMCGMIPGEFIHTFGDAHIYENHKDATKEQLSRTPTKLPTLDLPDGGMWDGSIDDVISCIDMIGLSIFDLKDYKPQSSIKADLSTG